MQEPSTGNGADRSLPGGNGPPPRVVDAPVSYVVAAVLLLAAFVGLLWVPSYSHLTPSLGGIPFFYWYSILWLVANAACQAAAYTILVVVPRRKRLRG